jgi:alpha-N-arabinofuranosidase
MRWIRLSPVSVVLQLYRQHFGAIPVAISGDMPPLDASAALTADRRALTLAVVNPTEQSRRVRLKVSGRPLTCQGERWTITGPNRWAHNQPGAPSQVDIRSAAVANPQQQIELAPLSVTLLSLGLR